MDRETYQRGLEIRSAVLGEAYVNRALADADDFTASLQDLLTRVLLGRGVGPRAAAAKNPQHAQLGDDFGPQPPQRIADTRQGGTH